MKFGHRPAQRQQKGRPWSEYYRKPRHKEDTCWVKHGKPTDWKPRRNIKNRGYQALVDQSRISKEMKTGAFNLERLEQHIFSFHPEQLEQLHHIFSSLQTSSHSFTHNPSSSLAHKGSFLKALNISSRYRTPWIINLGASDHMTDAYHPFTSYSSCAGNIKVKIANGSLSSMARK